MISSDQYNKVYGKGQSIPCDKEYGGVASCDAPRQVTQQERIDNLEKNIAQLHSQCEYMQSVINGLCSFTGFKVL